VTTTTTRSPGSAWRTKTALPSWRATQKPPWPTGPTSTSKRSPTWEAPRAWRVRGRRPDDLLTTASLAQVAGVGALVDLAAPQVAGKVLAYQRRAPGERSIVVINTGDAARFDATGLPARSRWRQVFPEGEHGALAADAAGKAPLSLAARSVRVYVATD
jgi:hypothetical protein